MCLAVGNACLTSFFKWFSFKWSYCCKLCLQDWTYSLVKPECSSHGPQDWLVFTTMTAAVLTNRPLFWADRRLARTASSPVSAEMNWWRVWIEAPRSVGFYLFLAFELWESVTQASAWCETCRQGWMAPRLWGFPARQKQCLEQKSPQTSMGGEHWTLRPW